MVVVATSISAETREFPNFSRDFIRLRNQDDIASDGWNHAEDLAAVVVPLLYL